MTKENGNTYLFLVKAFETLNRVGLRLKTSTSEPKITQHRVAPISLLVKDMSLYCPGVEGLFM